MGFKKKSDADKAYRDGKPIMTDAEYEDQFGANASDMDTPEKFDSKVRHQNFMSSLHKIKTVNEKSEMDLSEIRDWWHALPTDAIVVGSWKYDGLACELVYEDGELKVASTRGDGEYGEDITENVLRMKNIKKKIDDYSGTLLAEIIITHEDFKIYLDETIDTDPYDNPRNGASGAARKSDSNNAKYCSLRYYGADIYDDMSEVEVFDLLSSFELESVYCKLLVTYEDFVKFYNEMLLERDKLGFEVDGLVIAVNDTDHQNRLGNYSNKRPKYKLAVKFPAQSKETKLLDIEWQVGKTGRITPVGIIEEVDLGVRVNRVTLANINFIKRKWRGHVPRIGDIVEVCRAGDVIPFLVNVGEKKLDGTRLNMPKSCSKCKHETEINGAFLVCSNEFCAGRELGNLEKWIETMKKHFRIHCIGPERLRELYQNKDIVDVSDLYRLNENDLHYSLSRVGEKSAQNMLRFQNYKKIPLHVFMGALNIPGVGSSIWKLLIENSKYNTIEKIIYIENYNSIYQLNIEGIGESRAKMMYAGIKARKQVIEELIMLGVTPFVPEKIFSDSVISGKSFCVSGVFTIGRHEFHGRIKMLGGIVKTSISKKTDYLIVGENVGRTKLEKAEKCGTKIITEEQFNVMLEK